MKQRSAKYGNDLQFKGVGVIHTLAFFSANETSAHFTPSTSMTALYTVVPQLFWHIMPSTRNAISVSKWSVIARSSTTMGLRAVLAVAVAAAVDVVVVFGSFIETPVAQVCVPCRTS